MKAFFGKKPVKIIGSIILILVLAVCICNGYFASVALKEQKGVAVCDKWSPDDAYTSDYAKNFEIGDKDYKILCLTDVHIRNHGTFAACLGVNFILDGMSEIQLKKLIKNEQPDLIIVGGDTVLTAWNDICTRQFCEFMEKFGIPWAPIFGNHDYEGRADKAKLAEIYESYENCLFKSGPEGMDGMGNYIINLTRNDKPVYTLFMFDDGQFRVTDGKITYGGIGENQIKWYKWAVDGIASENGGNIVPNMAFMHVPVPEYKERNDNFKMGLRLEETTAATVNDGFFEAFKANGGTHMYCGHDHINNFISEKDGIELNYMTKSSYNCYFSFKELGGLEITLDKDNNVNERIVEF
ncbi:MAG: metallophosphoesterase [Ruminococcus sp.]|nr:metallophosphoesterase [Ruminococcus sp.]MDY3895469.1 metallophosphoesterase [Candidatus Fimenecus sp.]